ncbi:unnamed protein product [Rotaria socialis]|uniref:Uncharacterized protein n=1 Tax=Rotaria socialis TaxID=392032 RepID=A0A818DND8_9BILA|nr:unnamed protein product [Rotaria socialis]
MEANSTHVPILNQSNTIENLSQQQSTFYEENRPSFHETIANELSSTIQSQRSLSPLTNSDIESNEDDEELFDLRKCISNCYKKFKDSWIKDQQEIYEEQFHDVEQPIPQTYTEQIKKSTPCSMQPEILSSISPSVQQMIPQSNTILSISCDHKE